MEAEAERKASSMAVVGGRVILFFNKLYIISFIPFLYEIGEDC